MIHGLPLSASAVHWTAILHTLAQAPDPERAPFTTADWTAALHALATPPKTDPYQEAVAWAKAHAALLVTAVTAETKATIQLLVQRAFTEGIPPRKLAKLILSETTLGLTAKQAAQVLALRQKLAAHPGRTYIVGKKKVTVPKKGASDDWLDKTTTRYAGGLLKQRALTIARTETIKAAAAGQHSFWGKMRDKGLLKGDELRRWSATDDKRTCEICAYLDGQEVAFDEPFLTEDGEEIMTPPSHPNCRCSVVLAIGGADADLDAAMAHLTVYLRALYREDQDRDDHGRFAPEGGGKDSEGTRARKDREAGDARVYHRPVAIKVNTVEEAVTLIHEGKVVEVRDLKQAHTLINRLAEIATAAEEAGGKAHDYDLCQVSVAGSNLFCAESLRTEAYPEGIPRIDMPQLSGKAEPGTPADRLPKTERGTVNGGDAFVEHLEGLGLRTQDERVDSARLRPSQRELRGKDVGKMMRQPGYDPGARPIFVSRDDYVVDGHHRWAASVGRDLEDGKLGTSKMNVRRIDAPISEVLRLANKWTRTFGIKQRGMSHLRALYREDQARDEGGRFTDEGGGDSYAGGGSAEIGRHESGQTEGGGGRTVAFGSVGTSKGLAQAFPGVSKTAITKLAHTLTRHLPGDLEIRVDGAPGFSGDPARVSVRAISKDTNTELEVRFERHDDGRLTSDFEKLRLDKAQQGEDRGKAIVADLFAIYDQHGVETVALNANIDVGGYAWAKYGFTVDLPQDFSRKMSAKLDAITKHKGTAMTATDKAAIRKVLKDHQDDPKLTWVLAGLHVGDRHIGKELLLGSAWNASMDLKNAEQRERLDRYIAKGKGTRGAEARALYREDQAREADGKFAPEGGGAAGTAGIPPLGRSGDSEASGGGTEAKSIKTPGTVERTSDGKISTIVKKDGKTVTFVELPTGFNPAVAKKLIGMDENQLREHAAQMVQNLPGDVEVKLKAQHIPGQDPVVTIMAHDPEGVTEMWRVITKHDDAVVAKHVYFQLDEKHQGKDVAKHVMADTFKSYEAMGVEKVTLDANIDVGGYAWAKYGFTAKDPETLAMKAAAKVIGIFHNQTANDPEPSFTAAQSRAIEKVIDQHKSDPKLPWIIAGLHIGDRHIGKELLMGASWEGEIDLKNPEHTTRLHSYLSRPPKGASWRGLYREDQERDESGKFAPEGGGSESPAATKAAASMESQFAAFQERPENKGKEIAGAINRATGEVIYVSDKPYVDEANPRGGGVDTAEFAAREREAGDENVLHYHTHPDDNAFSDGDWKVISQSHIGEMRVVTENHVYGLAKTPAFAASDWKTRYPAKLQEEWNGLADELWDSVNETHKDADPSEYVAELTRRINTRMAAQHGLIFTKRSRTRGAKRALYREDQARDEGGKFTDEGGGDSRRGDGQRSDTETPSERPPLPPAGAYRTAIVEARAKEMAAFMGVDPEIVHVVDKEPRAFTVGNQQFHEAGHYDPTTRQIEINARNAYHEIMTVTTGLAAHEVSHAIFHDVMDVIEHEHKAINGLISEAAAAGGGTEWDRLFKKNGYPRPEAMDEIKRRWPASAEFAQTWGDSYLSEDTSVRDKMMKENGHSAYAKAYWTPEAMAKIGGLNLAVNETLAEINRYLEASAGWADPAPKPRSPWVKMAKGMRRIHKRYVAKKKATA